MENREEALISIDREPLEERMKNYFDRDIDWQAFSALDSPLSKNFARFNAIKTREKALKSGSFTKEALKPLLIRPMDRRWCYYTALRPIWNEPRPAYVEQLWPSNATLVTRRKGVASPEGVPFFFTKAIGFQHALHTDAYFIPFQIHKMDKSKAHPAQANFLSGDVKKLAPIPNLSPYAASWIKTLKPSTDSKSLDDMETKLWPHVLAIGYSPRYLEENADGIRQNWPRLPLPDSEDALWASAQLGEKIALLLDTESPLNGVTSGDLRRELQLVAVTARADGGNLEESELVLRAGWGHVGKGGVTMPGKGRVVGRLYSKSELDAIRQGSKALGLSEKKALYQLGEFTCDIYLNEVAHWSNVPAKVWDYTIGGYQVIKKWLSYREEPILGRPLTKEEVRYVQEMARRIAAILLLQPALDANYETVKKNTYRWPWKETPLET